MSETKPRHRISVLGAGNFGTVIANVIAENGYQPKLWVRRPELAQQISSQRVNEHYLPGIKLSSNMQVCSELASSIDAATIIFLAIPSKSIAEIATQIKPLIGSDVIIVSTVKGIHKQGFKLISQVLQEHLPDNKIVAMSGPNIAKEIADKQFSATVVAHADQEICDQVAQVLHSSYLRVYTNPDIYGVQLAGALKNIYAIMSGFVEEIGLGDNTKSMLMTRALAEMSRFAVKLGANPLTFLGLAGVGDLLVTCMSPISRNFRVGQALAQGRSLDQALSQLGQVAEGVNTLKTIKNKADELDVYMPLASAMYGLLFEGRSLEELAKGLTQGDRNTDVDFVLE